MTRLPGTGAGGSAEGHLAENILHFARALRRAGVRVGTAQVIDAIRAVEAAGFSRKGDFHAILRACLVIRSEHLAVFDQTFALFWKDPDYIERMIHMLSPLLRSDEPPPKPKSAQRRAEEALADSRSKPATTRERDEIEIDATLSWSANEVLRAKDFEQMNSAEASAAGAALRQLTLPVPPILTRRKQPAARGSVDLRGTLRRSLRHGGEPTELLRRAPVRRPPALVALCDISGSMTSYSRMLMHFLHALGQRQDRGWGRVHVFTFGTRLTNVTRAMARRDADAALEAVGHQAQDWEGGTRIGAALARFNRDWSRRVLAEGAAVLLITDGLERGDTTELSAAAERLHLSCRRLIWLNPLLRFDAFEARAGGIRALLPHVDSLHACHSLDSLTDLASALSGPGQAARLRAA